MGAQLRFGTAGATGGGWSAQPGSLQPAINELTHEPRWSWQARSPKTWKDRIGWISKWSWGCRTTGGGEVGGMDGAASLGQSMSDADLFEPYSRDGEGSQSIKFVLGKCVDSSDVAIANATVQGFVTATDTFTGEAVSKDDGTYQVPTQFPGVAHYLVAYKTGAPDIGGTTVNTLIPANLDGS